MLPLSDHKRFCSSRKNVRDKVVQELLAFSAKELLPSLFYYLDDNRAYLREAATRVAEGCVWPERRSRAFESQWITFWLHRMDESLEYVEQARKALGRLSFRRHLAELVERLALYGQDGPYPPLEESAEQWVIDTLLRFPTEKWLPAVLKELPEAYYPKAILLLRLLATRQVTHVTPFLRELFQTTVSHPLRNELARTFGILGDKAAIPLLLPWMEEVLQWIQLDNRETLSIVFVALEQLNAKEAAPRLAELLIAEDGWWFPFVKETLTRTLVRLDTPEADDALKVSQGGAPYSINSLFWTSRQENEH